MPSPFPGMDPYLEAPSIWPDIHDAFAGEIRNALNQALPLPYYARLEMRPEIGIAEGEGTTRRMVPDVTVVSGPGEEAQAPGIAVMEKPRTEVSKSYEVRVFDEPLRHHFVEIRDPSQGHKLITLIEIVSPSNKRHGPDREAYRRKQREVLESDASLIEIDLLRAGDRAILNPHVLVFIEKLEPRPDYLVLVNRAWTRAIDGTGHQVFTVCLREPLPCIPVPLRQGEDEVPLDLQFLFTRAYDTGPYRRGAVNYDEPPDPPLAPAEAEWTLQLLQRAKSGK